MKHFKGYVGNKELMEYYGNIDNQTGMGDISHMPINFCLLSDFKTDQFDVCPLKLKDALCSYLDSCKEKNAWPNFSLGNHDCPRSTTRFGSEAGSFAMNALLLFLPGTPLTYYGEEIAMLDNKGEQSRKYFNCGIFVKIIQYVTWTEYSLFTFPFSFEAEELLNFLKVCTNVIKKVILRKNSKFWNFSFFFQKQTV